MHQHEESLFHTAFEIEDPESRRAFLDQACGGDCELRGRIERLVSVFPKGAMLEPATEISAGFGNAKSIQEQVGDTIGNYELLEQLGEGGMGLVYMAQQTNPVRRKVALKIIKPGMDSGQIVARFEGERQTLAMMDHPNIARMFDAGTTDSGRPFFVMELVKGLPVTQFCDEQKLPTEDRLKLFRLVCQAVQHAHQKGVIHRDLKPSNVMIAMYDDRPVPKVIDFGVAKATSEPLTPDTYFTRFGEVIGTLQYMSPEQAQFNQLDVDTRSDIYSLGAVLYELRSGEPPFERERLRNQAFDETLRMIREEEPTKPSTKLRSATSSIQTAINRRTTTEKLNSIVRGDLDWIVLKALEKNRTRRYETADALALDVQRYLDKEPVSAGPPTRRYRFRKFALRNRKALIAATAIGITLVLGIVTTTWQANRASKALKEKTTALEEKTTALELSQESLKKSSIMTDLVLYEIIQSAKPDSDGPNATVREALFNVEEKMDSDGISDPQLESWLRHNIAGYFYSIGEYLPAKRNFLRAYDLRIKVLGIDDKETLVTAAKLSRIYSKLGEHDKSIDLAKSVANTQSRLSGDQSEEAVRARCALGVQLYTARRHKEAEEILIPAIDDARKIGLDGTAAFAVNNLGNVYFNMQEDDKAEKCWTAALESFRREFGDDHSTTVAPTMNLVNLLRRSGRFVEAQTALREFLPKAETIYGPNHPNTIQIVKNLSLVHWLLRDFTKAVELRRRSLQATRDRFGVEDLKTLDEMHLLATYLQNVDSEESRELHEQVVKIAKRELGNQDQNTLGYLVGLGVVANSLQDYRTASECHQEVIEVCQSLRSENPTDHWNTLMLGGAYCNLGNVLFKQERYAEAVECNSDAIDGLAELSKTDSSQDTRRFLSNSYEGRASARRRLGEHELSLADLQKALAVADTDRRKAHLALMRAKTIAAQGDYTDAIKTASAVFEESDEDGELAYELAAVFAIAANVEQKNRSTNSGSQAEQVAVFGNKCFETLEVAKSLGHFDLTKSILNFKIEPDFASILDDPRYSQFVESLPRPEKK